MERTKRRIAFFGGSFDPVHTGHMEMARAALEHLNLHRVYFVPASQSPLKACPPEAPAADRTAMINLAIGGNPAFSIWDGELYREGPSYTVDSVEHIERVYPNSHLFWIIGTDKLKEIPDWHRIGRLASKIGFILVRRPGYPLEWPGVPGLTLYPVDNPLRGISATEVRRRLRNNAPLDGLLPPAVEAYIRERGLYRAKM